MSDRSPDVPVGFVPGNVSDKYRSQHPIHRWLVGGFLGAARELAARAAPARVLEVGCGPGDLAASLFPRPSESRDGNPEYLGTDVSPEEVAKAAAAYPWLRFETASIYALPFPPASFDLVIACEVLEHLERPESAVAEVARVCGGHLLASVPWEPAWRWLNVARGAYLRQFGNTPGHLQHFGRRRFLRLVAGQFEVIEVRRPLPWTMVLARTRGHAAVAPGGGR